MRKLNKLKLKRIAETLIVCAAMGLSVAAQDRSRYLTSGSRADETTTNSISSDATYLADDGGGILGSGHIVSNDGPGNLGGGGRTESTESGGIVSTVLNWLESII